MCVYSRFAKAARSIALFGALSLSAALAQAVDFLDGDLQVHGFATGTLVNTSDNNWFGKSDEKRDRGFHDAILCGEAHMRDGAKGRRRRLLKTKFRAR